MHKETELFPDAFYGSTIQEKLFSIARMNHNYQLQKYTNSIVKNQTFYHFLYMTLVILFHFIDRGIFTIFEKRQLWL